MNGEDALAERIAGVEKMLMALRASDLEAIRVARQDVKEQMQGFPAEYARKSELEEIRATALRLDKTALQREQYDTAHEQLEEAVAAKLSIAVFDATVREWTVWRNSVDARITESIKAAAVIAAAAQGGQATWKQIAFFIGLATGVISLIVLLSNNII
jgi:hypothetical protein